MSEMRQPKMETHYAGCNILRQSSRTGDWTLWKDRQQRSKHGSQLQGPQAILYRVSELMKGRIWYQRDQVYDLKQAA